MNGPMTLGVECDVTTKFLLSLFYDMECEVGANRRDRHWPYIDDESKAYSSYMS